MNQLPEINELQDSLTALVPQGLDEQGIIFDNPLEVRKKIVRLEHLMNKASDVQLKIETTHRFLNGVYLRQVFIPKDTMIASRIHRIENFFIISSGDVTVITEDGAKRLKAPYVGGSKAGVKRILFTHEDTVWQNTYATNETDISKLEKMIFAEDFNEVEEKELQIKTIITYQGEVCPAYP